MIMGQTSINVISWILPIIVIITIVFIIIKSIRVIGGRTRMNISDALPKLITGIIPLIVILAVGSMIIGEFREVLNPGSAAPEIDGGFVSSPNPNPTDSHQVYQPTFEEENIQPLNLNSSPTYNYTSTNINYEELDYDYEMEKLYEGYDSLMIDVDDSLDMDLENI